MGIRKRGDKWLVTAESGRDEFVARRVCRSVDTEDEAKRLDAKLQHEVYEGRHVKPSSETVAAFCQRFLDGRDKIAPATRARHRAYLKHVKRDLGAVPLSRFTPRVAASWKKKQLASGDLSASTVRKHLVFVGAAMNAVVAQHLIAENPMQHVELPDDEPPPFHVYTPSEQAALLAAAARGTATWTGVTRGGAKAASTYPSVLDLAHRPAPRRAPRPARPLRSLSRPCRLVRALYRRSARATASRRQPGRARRRPCTHPRCSPARRAALPARGARRPRGRGRSRQGLADGGEAAAPAWASDERGAAGARVPGHGLDVGGEEGAEYGEAGVVVVSKWRGPDAFVPGRGAPTSRPFVGAGSGSQV